MKKTSMELTRGNIALLILQFALPIFVGQVFQNLYNSVDSIVVGRFVSKTALAAVTSCSDISHLLVGFFTGLSTGAGVLFSRHFGAKEYKELHDSIHTALTFSVILGAAMAIVGIFATPLLLRIVGCPEDVYAESSLYLRIYFVGILFTAMYNVGSGVLRAVGDSKSPFYYLVFSSIVNIVLDLLFVIVFKMGVAGVAIATIIAQAGSVALVVRQMLKTNDVYKLVVRDLKIDKKILLEVMDLGLPAAIQASLISISNLFVQRYINSFGSSAMAGIGAAKKIDKFAGLISQSLGLATTTFVSQNHGAGRLDRAYRGIWTCLGMAFVAVAAMGIPIYYFAPTFVSLFTTDAEAITFGVGMITCMIPCYYFQSLNQVFANAVRGFGRSRIVMLCSLCGMIVCRQIFLAITMNLNWDVTNVYYGYPFGWGCAATLVMLYFFLVIRKQFKVERDIAA